MNQPKLPNGRRKLTEITRKYLDAIPQRAAIEKRLIDLQIYEWYLTAPPKRRQVFLLQEQWSAESVRFICRRLL